MKKKSDFNGKGLKVFLLISLILLSASLISADVGLGISPSKIRDQVNSGETYSIDVLVFNTGSNLANVTLSYSGDLSDMVQISPSSQEIESEPVPHEFPIKNGKVFKVTFKIPTSSSEKSYKGVLSAVGGSSSGTNFGGSVGVSSQIELVSIPSNSFFSSIPLYVYIVLGGIVLLILIIFLLKKAGLNIEFKKKS